jgi:hypothetical protein
MRLTGLHLNGVGDHRRSYGIRDCENGHHVEGVGDEEVLGVPAGNIEEFDSESYGHVYTRPSRSGGRRSANSAGLAGS